MLLTGCSNEEGPSPTFVNSRFDKSDFSQGYHWVHLGLTNTFLASLDAHKENAYYQNKSISFDVGGLAALKSYLSIFKNRFPRQFLLLDTGQRLNANKSLEEKTSILKKISTLNYDSVMISKIELKSSLENNDEYFDLKKTGLPYISSNIIDLKKNSPLALEGQLPYQIFTRNNITIGVFGVFSRHIFKTDTLKKSLHLMVEDQVATSLRIFNIFKKKNVSFTILLTDYPTSCHSTHPTGAKSFRKNSKTLINCPKKDDPLYQLLNRLPPKIGNEPGIDLILSGGQHFSTGLYKKTMVVQTPGQGSYLSIAHLAFDPAYKTFLPKESRIDPPTKLCHQFFKGTMDCFIHAENSMKKRSHYFLLVPPIFLGKEVIIHK